MEPVKCIIVDDEPLALDLLEEYVTHTPFLRLEGKMRSGVEALSRIQKGDIDVAFMDIQMPHLSGLEVSRLIESCAIIFTTAFEQYALEGYKVNALDYLLKPFSYGEFLAAANKAAKWVQTLAAAKKATSQNDEQYPAQTHRTLAVKSEYRQILIHTSEITYIEVVGDYLKINLQDGKPVLTLLSLKAIEESLPSEHFIRVHRSFIVNIDKVKTIERNRIVFGKVLIPISDSYKDNFNKHLQLLS